MKDTDNKVMIDLGNGLIEWDRVTEIWKDIPNFEGHYQASTLGRIKNSRRGNILEGSISKSTGGYRQYCLYKDGEKSNHLGHTLVADTFIPNPNHLRCVNHKDENKLNNRVDNLERCTQHYNVNYSSAKEVAQIDLKTGEILRTFKSIMDVYRLLGYNKGCIANCCNGKRKQAYNYRWEYTGNGCSRSYVGVRGKGSSSIKCETYNRDTGDTVKTYPSMSALAKDLRVDIRAVYNCLNGLIPTVKKYGVRRTTDSNNNNSN